MPRTYSEPFLIELTKLNPNRAGTALALACVQANLPAKYIAEVLSVSRMTVFSWFRGKPLRHKNLLKAEVITDVIESDLAKGVLPAKNTAAAKAYTKELASKI